MLFPFHRHISIVTKLLRCLVQSCIDFWIQTVCYFDRKGRERAVAERCSWNGIFAGIQEIELLSSVRSEIRVCPSRMTNPAITCVGVATVPRTIDIAVERINIGAAGNRSAAIFDRSGETHCLSEHIFFINT